MRLLDTAQINLDHKEKTYTIAFALFSLCAGFMGADFVAAATVVYSVGPLTGMKAEHVFLNPEGGIFRNLAYG